LEYIGPGQKIPSADLIVLPGSKNVRDDLKWLRDQGWEPAIQRHLRYGGKLMGICAGYQMLGRLVQDPEGMEGPPGTSSGLDLLDLSTQLAAEKQLCQVKGRLLLGDVPITGYEIHCGITRGAALARPLVKHQNGNPDGVISTDGQILGTYWHGLFDTPQACDALLQWAGLATVDGIQHPDRNEQREQDIHRLADCIEQHLSLDEIFPDTLQTSGR
jgi:adenosylcobyric acid synthase